MPARAVGTAGATGGSPVPTLYFDEPGPQNTVLALEAALERARRLGLTDMVVASTTGYTARTALEAARAAAEGGRGVPGLNLVVVTHHVGFAEAGQDEMPRETREELEAAGAKLLTTTHLFGGVERAVTRQFGGLYPGHLIAHSLRLFGEGTKVAVEIAVMALDAGLVPYGRDVVSVGGSGRGADTALVVRPAHARTFFETRVLEVVCRPRPRRPER